jgi:hypothetical protein
MIETKQASHAVNRDLDRVLKVAENVARSCYDPATAEIARRDTRRRLEFAFDWLKLARLSGRSSGKGGRAIRIPSRDGP